jgi:hypothetical protein
MQMEFLDSCISCASATFRLAHGWQLLNTAAVAEPQASQLNVSYHPCCLAL